MKKMSRKNFRGGPLFSTKSSSSTASHSNSSSPGMGEAVYVVRQSEKDGIPYVSKATESCISSAVNQGDILKFVNVVRSKDHSFSDFFKILATMKKPVLLRFERLSASTPSSDDEENAQLFGVPRSSSTNTMNPSSHYARQNVPHGDETDMAGKIQRANSVPQKDQKPPKATRGAFWRAAGAKDSVSPVNSSHSIGPNAMNGGSDHIATPHEQRRLPSNKDHQVSPRDVSPANGSGGNLSHSPLGPHEYQVYWETGPLGLFFGENRSTSLPVVTRSTPSANPVVRCAVAVNDTLVSANGIKSAEYTFEAFFGRLQQMNKPVRLVFRRRQSTDAAVTISQGESQQQQQQLQPRQQQMREQEQKRELHRLRDQQEREQQQLREQEQLLREQQQQELYEQRQQQIREQKQREQQVREQKQREQELREQQQREQQICDQKQREQELREQLQREQPQREQLQREQLQREQLQREQPQREQQQTRDQKQRHHHEGGSRSRTSSGTQDASQSSSTLPNESITHHRNHTSSPITKRASTTSPCASSLQVQLESDGHHHEHRHGDKWHERTPPPGSPVMSKDSANTGQRDVAENVSGTNYQMSPKVNTSSMVRSLPKSGNSSPSASPNMGSSPKVSSSPLTSPSSPYVATEITNDASDLAPPSAMDVADEAPVADFATEVEKGAVELSKESLGKNVCGNRSRNSSEEQRRNQKAATTAHEAEPVLSPVSSLTRLSPTEPWDLPEYIPSPRILKVGAIAVDKDIDAGMSLLPSADIDLEDVVMAKKAKFAVEAELFDEVELTEVAEVPDKAECSEAGLPEEDGCGEEDELANEAEFILPPLPVGYLAVDSANLDVEVGMLADIEMGIAVDEADSEVAESSVSGSDQNTSPWDLELESDDSKIHHHHRSSATSVSDESMSSSGGSALIDNNVETSKVDFADASDPSDEFSHDPDISRDIDSVESDIMMREAPKDKMDSANVPKPNKSPLHANLAKYKKKGKTGRGVVKLPALSEDDALTVPLVAPNAVNTTIQVRGRPKPKLTMADTPDSTTFLIKWKENRSIGLQLKEVRLAKGTYPLVTDVCHEPCCELLRHICVGDVIVEINGRNTSTMGVKKTVNFLKTCTKTTLMKIRHGPAFVNQRVRATV
ncbi:unnamed protein product [Peronospora belbahrii]|uniref:PDZ domain-containing protein n=1 Tax=Peronospora belbahrii TaxID=622444 RepID=A0AAU9L063_9STRA|nr:unnamed protein product [Peronospora belbahrii]